MDLIPFTDTLRDFDADLLSFRSDHDGFMVILH